MEKPTDGPRGKAPPRSYRRDFDHHFFDTERHRAKRINL